MTDIQVPITKAPISQTTERSCFRNMSKTAIEENTFDASTIDMINQKTFFNQVDHKPLKSSFMIRVCVANVTSIVTTGIKKLKGGLSVH